MGTNSDRWERCQLPAFPQLHHCGKALLISGTKAEPQIPSRSLHDAFFATAALLRTYIPHTSPPHQIAFLFPSMTSISSTGDARLRPTVADGRAYIFSGVMVAGANQGCSLSLQPHSLAVSVRLSAHLPDGSVLRAASQGYLRFTRDTAWTTRS
jgi:hypothetical protein